LEYQDGFLLNLTFQIGISRWVFAELDLPDWNIKMGLAELDLPNWNIKMGLAELDLPNWNIKMGFC
jgi:hypothetical protein